MPEAGNPRFNRENRLMFLDLIRDSLFMNIEMTHFPLYLSSFHSWGVGAHSSSGGGRFRLSVRAAAENPARRHGFASILRLQSADTGGWISR